MAFFRKWKTHYKHKKFSSDETVDVEDWGLDKPIKDEPNLQNMKIDLDCVEAVDEEGSQHLFATYEIKYLGCTAIESKRSEKQTSEAIKTVITNSKAGGRKNKSQTRVKLNISKDGIEVLDQHTQDSLMRFSIYKISYCSVDAAHDHTFSFVGSEKDPVSQQERMACHVFHCPKRKIAHEITLMVARCFENAYQQWRDTVVMQSDKNQGMNLTDNSDMKKVLKEHDRNSNTTAVESRVEVHQPQSHKEERVTDNLLIDFASSDNDIRKYLQNAWVSFEDEAREGIKVAAC